MTRHRRPRYSLSDIKARFANPARLNRTLSAAAGADALGLDEVDVVRIIQGLTLADFEKSMLSDHDRKSWQDVYKPVIDGRELYVKVTLDARGQLLLISFKGND